MYQNYIFDLYGTLVDIQTDELSNVVYALYYDHPELFYLDTL